jgi:gliding motility-associated-like protein
MNPRSRIVIALILAVIYCRAVGQSTCPENIGFESGNFNHWECFAGTIDGLGTISGTIVSPTPTRHTILKNTIPQQLDPFGNFPVNCPNGSGYSIKLGNQQTGQQVDRVSYTFVVPAGQNDYSIIYNYAIVFQDPGHLPYEQPRFTSKVYDQTAGEYLGCGSFEYVASSGIPGFAPATGASNVWYKPWSPVTVKLMNCAGKTITIEFTVNDCTRGGHFGYAYLDINENCTSPITGNVYCNGNTSLTLSAPFGFQSYKWYTSDFSGVLGTSNILHLAPIPPVGTRLALEITPYPGVGCLDTLYTTIQLSPDGFHFEALDSVIGCVNYPVDLTSASLTQGSSPGLTFSYFLDSTLLQYLAIPSQVISPGTFYIKAVNSVGCTETQKILLSFRDIHLYVTDPPVQCYPNVVNLTDPAISNGSDAGLSYTYWKNIAATDPVPDPAAVPESGQYYIKAQNSQCTKTLPVQVTVWTPDNLKTNAITNCITADLTAPEVTLGSAAIFNGFSYWLDDRATTPVSTPKNITSGGTYYIKAMVNAGCYFTKPVNIIIKPGPDFTISDPPVVTAPATVDIRAAANGTQNYAYSFWQDDKGTKPLADPSSIPKTGVYYIKALDTAGCFILKPVTVTVIIPYHPVIKYPNAFSPNKDGVNDGFRISVVGNITWRTFKIYDRWGRMVFETQDPLEYWYGEANGKPLPVGTYYWIMELVNNNNNDFYRKTGTITLLR